MLECLDKLADPSLKYSLTDREMFLSDLENILKILTIEEIRDKIIPALDIYSTEQEFLKLQFFQKLPSLFLKMLNEQHELSRPEAMIILTEYVFPVI